MRTREHLTVGEVDELIDAAKANRLTASTVVQAHRGGGGVQGGPLSPSKASGLNDQAEG